MSIGPITSTQHASQATLRAPESDDGSIRSIQAKLAAGIKGNDDTALTEGLTAIRDIFPKLTLFQRILDFFGLSREADNQRDVSTMCATGMVNCILQNESEDNRASLEQRVIRGMQEVGLTGDEQAYSNLATLTAETIIRLLKNNPGCNITLDKVQMTATESEGGLLNGQVTLRGFGGTGVKNLGDLSLPFSSEIVSLRSFDNMMYDEGCQADTFRTLYNLASPKDAVDPLLFSPEGVLAGLEEHLISEHLISDVMSVQPSEKRRVFSRRFRKVLNEGSATVKPLDPKLSAVAPPQMTNLNSDFEILLEYLPMNANAIAALSTELDPLGDSMKTALRRLKTHQSPHISKSYSLQVPETARQPDPQLEALIQQRDTQDALRVKIAARAAKVKATQPPIPFGDNVKSLNGKNNFVKESTVDLIGMTRTREQPTSMDPNQLSQEMHQSETIKPSVNIQNTSELGQQNRTLPTQKEQKIDDDEPILLDDDIELKIEHSASEAPRPRVRVYQDKSFSSGSSVVEFFDTSLLEQRLYDAMDEMD